MLVPANDYFLHQELSLFVCRPVKKLHSAPSNDHILVCDKQFNLKTSYRANTDTHAA